MGHGEFIKQEPAADAEPPKAAERGPEELRAERRGDAHAVSADIIHSIGAGICPAASCTRDGGCECTDSHKDHITDEG